jgi:hypothetical protein
MRALVSRRTALCGLGSIGAATGLTYFATPAIPQAKLFQVPPLGFDPKSAPNEELQRYGLLARPSADSSPQYQKLWSRTYSAKVDFVAPTFRARNRYRRLPPQRRQTFNNWAGLAVQTSGTPLITVAGTWTIPYPRAPDDAAGNEPNYNSAWIGIDGYFPSTDILQAGVDFNFTTGSTEISIAPWWEWWPGDSYYIDSLQVSPGETFSCVIVGTAGGADALVQMTNLSSNRHVTFLATAPANTTLVGDCAEWIVERQNRTSASDSPISDLSQFGSVFFANAFASTSRPQSHGTVLAAGSGTPISMSANDGVQLIAVPAVLGPTSFRVDRV